MKKQSYYLPNLSVLLTQKRRYEQHKQRLTTSKSSIQCPKNMPQSNRQISSIQHKIAELSRISLAQIVQTQAKPLQAINYKVNRYCPSPFEKRKREEADTENLRICETILIKNSNFNKGNERRVQEYTSLKDRIGKFQRDGTKIIFKFKKSLQKVERRRQERQFEYSQRQYALDEQIKAHLWHLLKQPQIYSKRSKTTVPQRDAKEIDQNDIFYNDGSSIKLKNRMDNHQHKQKHQKHISSLNQSIKLSTPYKKFSQPFRHKILQQSKTITTEIPKNPQSIRKQRSKTEKSDFHIIQMFPISKKPQQ